MRDEQLLLARLDRIPVWPYPRRLLWVLGLGYFFVFFDLVNIGFALPVITDQFGISTAGASLMVSLGLVGYIVGAIAASVLSDRRNRLVALQLSVGLVTVGSLIAALSPSFGLLATLLLPLTVRATGRPLPEAAPLDRMAPAG